MSKRNFVLILAFILALALVFTGCTVPRRPYDNYDATGNRTSYTGTGTNRGYDTLNNTGAGANPGTTGYSTGNGIGTGYGTPSYRTVKDTGAGTNRGYDTANYTSENNNNRTAIFGTTGNGTGTAAGMGTNAGMTLSNRIATAVRQIQGVESATAVVTGDTAYVGVNVARNAGITNFTGTAGTTGNTANTTDIQRRVSQVVRALETSVDKVYVSTDASFINKLRTVDQGMRGGNATNGFTENLRDLVKGMTPTR